MARDAALGVSGLIIAPCLPDQRSEQPGRVPLGTWLTCAYTVSVIIGPAWPRRSLTTSTRLPAASSSVAWVCRRSCNRITGARDRGGVQVYVPPAERQGLAGRMPVIASSVHAA